jgi:nucleotide-binding universal stress UspA family protein
MTLPKVDVKKILYATDLSENARFAFAYAVSLANLYGAKIALLHVLPEVSELMEKHVIGYIDANQWEAIKNQHFDEVKEALIAERNDHPAVDDIIVERGGNPVEEILKQSMELNCDLIVLGTHGIGSLEDAMIGSTARRVVRRSTIPVLVVRLPEEA